MGWWRGIASSPRHGDGDEEAESADRLAYRHGGSVIVNGVP